MGTLGITAGQGARPIRPPWRGPSSRWRRAAANASGEVARRGYAPVQRARLVLLVTAAEQVADLDSRSATQQRGPKPGFGGDRLGRGLIANSYQVGKRAEPS